MKTWFSKINKTDKQLARHRGKKLEKMQMTKIRNKTGDVSHRN